VPLVAVELSCLLQKLGFCYSNDSNHFIAKKAWENCLVKSKVGDRPYRTSA